MRISEMISDQQSSASESDTEPGPSGHDRYTEHNQYVTQILELSRQLERDSRIRYKEWRGGRADSLSVKVGPEKIYASLAGRAFENYTVLSDDERLLLEAIASRTMGEVDTTVPSGDMQVMVNHVPLFFHPEQAAIIGHRSYEDATDITFDSDALWTPRHRDALLGGLATVLYYAENPHALRTVE